jgi:uracil permease
MLILGLQHMFAMFGATVLVPILVNAYGLPLSIQTTLFFAGAGTLFFHLCTKLKVPAFLGSSFAFLGGFSAVANLNAGIYANMAPAEKLQYACGATVITDLSTGATGPMLNFSGMAKASFIGLQPFITNFSGSVAKFDLSAILVMAPIAIASMMEHIGDISAISATVGENFIEDPGLHRTLIGDGLATSLAALFGGPANTTYGENTGVLVLSRVYDPRVIRLAALYAVILSFSPKFAVLVNSIPSAIIGGVSFILYGMISAIGVRNVVENQVDFTNSRNLIIAAVILVCGLGFTNGLTFTVGNASITLTSLAIAAIAGIALNAILPGNDFHFGKAESDNSGSLGKY